VRAKLTRSQNSNTTAPSGRELYHLQFALQVVSLGTFGYTLVHFQQNRSRVPSYIKKYGFDASCRERSYENIFITLSSYTKRASKELKSMFCCKYSFWALWINITVTKHHRIAQNISVGSTFHEKKKNPFFMWASNVAPHLCSSRFLLRCDAV